MEYTEGICGDGAAILRDGKPMTISEILAALNGADALRAKNERLRSAILSAHPTGEEPGADPFEVLDALSREWINDMMRGPVSEIAFMDGDAERKIVFEVGDDSVGIPDCYVTLDDPSYSDLAAELAALKEAVRPAVDGYMKVKDQATWDGQRVVPETIVMGGSTVAQWEKLAALVGEGF